MQRKKRSIAQKVLDFLTFPVRSVSMFWEGRLGLSPLNSERWESVAQEVRGYCLDIGCGPHNRFISQYLGGNGVGLDVILHEGLTEANLLKDPNRFPYPEFSFDSVTFIGSLNYITRELRDIELAEAYRCLKDGGNVIVTMGTAVSGTLLHLVINCYDSVLGTNYTLGLDREFYLKSSEIVGRLENAGFERISRKRILTQWCLSQVFIGWKLNAASCHRLEIK